ncbi:hypothetical protein [Solitalea canadensis]|uniref:Mis12-Mtw1 protein family n=1 Tax=Solitalea canadensis (strain ATCC 29591 / DSM 3403 / JCM 21819 / LMG 8368 / NBRC 15130 / NCIMB 12057 / USAM 9D) TaxID=929556 RepID=H8KP14_SOLCM|nr:hypothetical protein [Solitalea canadensis]AFD05536.1 hypothetical protein Solca_0396 [Solitalea canadensis DSM 3403]
MSELVKTLEHLQQKMQKLMVLHNKLQKEHMELLAELNEAKEVSETRRTTILELEDQLKAARLASSLSGGSEKALDIQQKINEFAKEIDRCIELLTK